MLQRSLFYFTVSLVLDFKYRWLYDRFQMAHKVLCKPDREGCRQADNETDEHLKYYILQNKKSV